LDARAANLGTELSAAELNDGLEVCDGIWEVRLSVELIVMVVHFIQAAAKGLTNGERTSRSSRHARCCQANRIPGPISPATKSPSPSIGRLQSHF
jgi:hypothetical protein